MLEAVRKKENRLSGKRKRKTALQICVSLLYAHRRLGGVPR
jgi:hypothetical protein